MVDDSWTMRFKFIFQSFYIIEAFILCIPLIWPPYRLTKALQKIIIKLKHRKIMREHHRDRKKSLNCFNLTSSWFRPEIL